MDSVINFKMEFISFGFILENGNTEDKLKLIFRFKYFEFCLNVNFFK